MQYRRDFQFFGGVVLILLALTGSPTWAASPNPTASGVKPQGSNCPANAPVKGNVRHGQKIYHLPSSPNYQQIKPEACFSSATAAQQAGFRPPKTSSGTTQH